MRDRITGLRKEGDPRDGWERLVDHLYEIAIGDTSANDRDQIAAAKLLAERAYGHPKQTMDLHATGSALDRSDVSKLSDEELIEIAALDHTGQSAD